MLEIKRKRSKSNDGGEGGKKERRGLHDGLFSQRRTLVIKSVQRERKNTREMMSERREGYSLSGLGAQ